MHLTSKPEIVDIYRSQYNNCNIRYGDMKKQLAEDMVNFIAPIRDKVNAILNDEKYLNQVMEKGAAKARASAGLTMQLVREAMGLNYWKQ